MKNYQIRALRAHPDYVEKVADGLRKGVARFGWSYAKNGDLRVLAERIEAGGWDELGPSERDCWQPFLLDLEPNDWLVYVNVPSYGRCTIARVNGRYS